MQLPKLYSIAYNAVTVEFSQEINVETNRRVMDLHRALEKKPFKEYIESVPAFNSLTIYSSASLSIETCKTYIEPYIENKVDMDNHVECKLHTIPVCYDPTWGFDQEFVCTTLQLPIEKIIQLHTSTVYDVFMIGFVPGFPYLGILPKELEIPRKQKPSLRIPAGSVAIAGKQTGIYPTEIPGGWHVIGRTPIQIFDPNKNPCCTFEPGDQIQFEPISLSSFNAYT